MDSSFIIPQNPTAEALLLQPLAPLLDACAHRRDCPGISDAQWLRAGLSRVLHAAPSGRGFIQQFAHLFSDNLVHSLFFAALKSPRRLALCAEISAALARSMPANDDPFATIKALAGFDLYAADGHWHGAAAHDPLVDGHRRPAGHFYALNLRTRAARHLAAALDTSGHEHDMHAIKRLGAQTLRLDAKKGRKVVYAYDCAGIDFQLWHYWKHQAGIYFISRTKENMRLETIAEPPFDPNDPVNNGVLSDVLVATSQHVAVRLIHYQDPASGEEFEFITSEYTLPPGLIAFIHKRRWDIEKVFDAFKNKFGQTRAWATGMTARAMQAHFLCLAHNLLLLFEQHMESGLGVANQAEQHRRRQRLAQQQESARLRCMELPPLVARCQRPTQTSLKLIRLLRSFYYTTLPLGRFLALLSRSYASL
jgi:hypothetical protein